MKDTKSLGPEAAELLLTLGSQGKTIFSTADAEPVTGKTRKATGELLRRLVDKGWLVRLMRGRYLILPLEGVLEGVAMADRYVIARELMGSRPYYISHSSAMELHDMTLQPAATVYVTVNRQRPSRVVVGINYHFVYASERFFWGWQSAWVTAHEQVRVSDLEKTVLDCAVRPQLCGGLKELGQGLWMRRADVDYVRLAGYAERLRHKAAAKRIGFLLETYGLGAPEAISALQSLVGRSYDLLDPTLPDEGTRRRRWRLRVNLEPEELRRAVST